MDAATTTEREYREALAGFDWQYEFSDDGRVYRAGRDRLVELRAMQQRVDPTGQIWIDVVRAKFRSTHGCPMPQQVAA